MITITNSSKSFGSKVLWENLELAFSEGSFTALTGRSGSGKSTLLNCLGALEMPDQGAIVVDGIDITTISARQRRLYRLNQVGYLFQDYALIPDRSVKDNVTLALPKRTPRADRVDIIDDSLKKVDLEGYETKDVHELSGGEQQRTALARLLVKNPQIVLADEPTGALDEVNAEMVIKHLREFANRGAVVIVATHSKAVADKADHCVKMADLQ